MTIKEIRQRTGLSQRKFADKYGLPFRTMQGWEAGRKTPEYVIRLLDRCVNEDFKKDVDI